jgi:hypothetical protein
MLPASVHTKMNIIFLLTDGRQQRPPQGMVSLRAHWGEGIKVYIGLIALKIEIRHIQFAAK